MCVLTIRRKKDKATLALKNKIPGHLISNPLSWERHWREPQGLGDILFLFARTLNKNVEDISLQT